MKKIDNNLYKKLESLSRDDLYHILMKAGITFTQVKKEYLSKEELLLVADEADIDILESLLKKIDR
ncbi:MAG TPA: hypothetical protein VJJ28_01845 [Candidatus Paceibacterota bacterium]